MGYPINSPCLPADRPEPTSWIVRAYLYPVEDSDHGELAVNEWGLTQPEALRLFTEILKEYGLHLYGAGYGEHYADDGSVEWTTFINGKELQAAVAALRSIA